MIVHSLLGAQTGSNKNILPAEYQPAFVRYARWDGGPLEVAKAQLSGWYYMDDPKAIEATCNWYQSDGTFDLLAQAKVNWIWVTVSCGFSMATESRQWELLAPFIKRCHDSGIRVTAYMSMTNIFIDDMRREFPDIDQWLQVDINGKPVPYGAAKYKSGKITRILACFTNPKWHELQLKRLEAALALGVEGVVYDNMWDDCRCPRCTKRWREFTCRFTGDVWPWPDEEAFNSLDEDAQRRLPLVYQAYRMYSYGTMLEMLRSGINEVRPGVLLYANFQSWKDFFSSVANTAISLEDCREPGIIDGQVRSNIGLIRRAVGAGAGFRPVRIEYGRDRTLPSDREVAEVGIGAPRFIPMRPEHHQLAMAEAHSLGANLELCPEGEFLRDLYFRTAPAMHNWQAIAQYNEFFATHSDLYHNVRTATKLAVVKNAGFHPALDDEYWKKPWLLGHLAEEQVILDVLCDIDICEETLSHYEVLFLPDTRIFDQELTKAMQDFVARGGKIIASRASGTLDERFRLQPASALDGLENVTWIDDSALKLEGHKCNLPSIHMPAGLSRLCFSSEPAKKLLEQLRSAAAVPVEIHSPETVKYNVTRDQEGRLIVHLINYADSPCEAVTITGEFESESADLFSPEKPGPQIENQPGQAIKISNLLRYAVVRLAQK